MKNSTPDRWTRTLQETVAQYQVHPNHVGVWKRQAVEGRAEVFSKAAERWNRQHKSEASDLHAKIGELIVERAFIRAGRVVEPNRATRDSTARAPGPEPEPPVPPGVDRAVVALR